MSPALLSLLVASTCGGGVEVRVAADLTLDLEASNAPVTRVLECLSEEAGFKMVIEPGLINGQRVTISLSRRTPTQAVNGLLDGLALNYAYTTDPAGSRILMLLISGRADHAQAKGGTVRGSTAGGPAALRQPQVPGRTERAQAQGGTMGGAPAGGPASLRESQVPGRAERAHAQDATVRDSTAGGPALRRPPQSLAPPESSPPLEAPLYPEPRPLSPLTLRGSRQLHLADSRPPATTTDQSNRGSARPRTGNRN